MTDKQKWFLIWSHGRAPSRREKYVLFDKDVYEDESSIKAEVEAWAMSVWPTSSHVRYGWKEVPRLPPDIYAKKLQDARDGVQWAVEWLKYIEEYGKEQKVGQ
jgi:hypothetical protein